MLCLQILPKGPTENGAAMQVDDAEECHLRSVQDFEQELKQRCVAWVLLDAVCCWQLHLHLTFVNWGRPACQCCQHRNAVVRTASCGIQLFCRQQSPPTMYLTLTHLNTQAGVPAESQHSSVRRVRR